MMTHRAQAVWAELTLSTPFAVAIGIAAAGGLWALFHYCKSSDRRRAVALERQLRERDLALARAEEQKAEFLAAVVHDVLNPLNGVMGVTRMLQEATFGVREKFLLSTLARCAQQVKAAVEDARSLDEIQRGPVPLQTEPIDLAETVRGTAAAVEAGGGTVEVAWQGPTPRVTTDLAKITRIVGGLLRYGVGECGAPRVQLEVDVKDENEDSCRATMSVSFPRNGEGSATPDDLFQLKLASGGKEGLGRGGIDLFLSRRYAEALGGRLSAEHREGVLFLTLSLPLKKASAESVRTGAAARKDPARALAVEDEDYNRLVLGNVLSKLGYQADWAMDGKSAVALAQQKEYDLVVMDWMLPDMSGKTLIAQLKPLMGEKRVPILVVTAYSTKEKEAECRAAGASGFIPKPLSPEKLQAALDSMHSPEAGPSADPEEQTSTAVSLNQLLKLGPLAFIVPEFSGRLEKEWAAVEAQIPKSREEAAKITHKLVSATLLVEAQYVTDQLRLLEGELRSSGNDEAVERLRQICAEEIAKVAQSLRAAAKRRQRLNEAPKPK